MKLVNYEPFGNFVPGDEIEVEDGANYDTAYWRPAEESEPPAPRRAKGDD